MEEKFSFGKIKTPDLLQEAYKLRYQVYCKECHFIQESDYPLGYETDRFDEHSSHFGGFDNQQRLVGSVRLILPSCKKFPIEEHCSGLHVDPSVIPREKCAEVSRLTISKLYRRRANDGLYYEPQVDAVSGIDKGTDFTRRVRPMAFGLYREMYQESKRLKIRYWFALMERTLWLLLKIHGFVFRPIGDQVEFYGMVTPYLADLMDIERTVYQKYPQFFTYFMDGLEEDLRPKF
jgi:N-acyl amino acid synthase of PEP-CTERM/exosortase system